MIAAGRSPTRTNPVEQRRHKRTKIGLKGKIFIPQRDCDADCMILDFSLGGAGLNCSVPDPVGTRVVLYVPGFGRFEGTIVRRDKLHLGVEFSLSKVKRERTMGQLADFVAQGMTELASRATRLRTAGVPSLKHFVTTDGRKEDCEIVDIGLAGASFTTRARPAIGDVLAFGETAGVVVQHTNDGIAVEFVDQRAASQRRANFERLEAALTGATDALELRECEIDLVALIEDSVRIVSSQAADAGCALVGEFAPSLPFVIGDERAFKLVLLNLLDNAIKFTPAGGSITTFAHFAGDGGIAFGVRDTGVGIAAEDLAKLFEKFGQGDREALPGASGTGHGLPIVKGLVESHGGKIVLDSAPGKGTCVTATIPVAQLRQRQIPAP